MNVRPATSHQHVICEECGEPLPDDPNNGCPKCLFNLALDDESGPNETTRRIGDYVILEEIAQGGMGVVYKARQESLGRLVAIKLLRGGSFASPEFAKRFRIEAQALAQLNHPNIVSVYEVGEDAGQLYFAMEYVPEGTLLQAVAEQPMPPRKAAEFLRDLSEAVHYAHSRGILHRDLKPSNVLLDSARRPRITDFGLSRTSSGDSQLTRTGQMLGTPSYASPEQISPERGEVTTLSDVYSLGGILYHLITGRPPFRSDSVERTMHQVLHAEPVSPRLLNPSVPNDLETICLKCLAKESGHRYDSAEALGSDLRRYLEGRPIEAKPAGAIKKGWRWCQRNPGFAAMLTLLAIVMVTGILATSFQWYEAEKARKETATALTRMELMQADSLFATQRPQEGLAYLAKILREDPHHRVAATRAVSALMHQRIPLPAFAPLTHDAALTAVDFSSDGRLILTASRDGTAKIWNGETGALRHTLTGHRDEILAARFSPSSHRVVTGSKDGTARIWNTATAKEVGPPAIHEDAVNHIDTSNNDAWFVTASDDGTARVWDLDSGNAVSPILQHESKVLTARFSEDSSKVVTASKDHTAKVWDSRTGEPATFTMSHADGRVHDAAFSPDGRFIATASRDTTAQMWDSMNGNPLGPPMEHHTWVMAVRFSPDSEKMLTTDGSSMARMWNTSSLRQITILPHEHSINDAQFSHSGRHIATASSDGYARLWTDTGAKPASLPMRHARSVTKVRFSPDDSRIVTGSEDHTAIVWEIPLIPLERKRFPHAGSANAVWLPDGKTILTRSADMKARVWNVETGELVGKPMEHDTLLINASVSPSGKWVATASRIGKRGDGHKIGAAQVWDARSGEPVSGPFFHERQVFQTAFSPDETLVATAASDGSARIWEIDSGAPKTAPLNHDPNDEGTDVLSVAFSPGGKRIATAATDGVVRVWDIEGEIVRFQCQHDDIVLEVSYDAEGNRLLSIANDNTARIWDAASGALLTPPLSHDNRVVTAVFSPDGSRVVSGSLDRTARYWNAHTGQLVLPPLEHEGQVNAVDVSPDGQFILTASTDGKARIWDVTTGFLLAEPFDHIGGVTNAAFAPDGSTILTSSTFGDVMIWAVPDIPVPVPPWFPQFLDSVGGRRLLEHGKQETLPLENLLRLKETHAHLLTESNGFYERWAHWFFHKRKDGPFRQLAVKNGDNAPHRPDGLR